ncbi:MAG: PIN domain-containing protein [Candidatus Portnoybacteria bacterium]|nr:PIN domain-containing protein [Candidatus Portnoybacteria bacterium]
MKPTFIDTNIFLRFLVKEDERSYKASANLLKAIAEGDVLGFTSVLVIAEIVWVLNSFYKFPRDKIANAVQSLLELPNLEVEQDPIIHGALDYFLQTKAGFIDCYNHAWMVEHGIDHVATFDSDWDTFNDVSRAKL